jgi:hypothetical protein
VVVTGPALRGYGGEGRSTTGLAPAQTRSCPPEWRARTCFDRAVRHLPASSDVRASPVSYSTGRFAGRSRRIRWFARDGERWWTATRRALAGSRCAGQEERATSASQGAGEGSSASGGSAAQAPPISVGRVTLRFALVHASQPPFRVGPEGRRPRFASGGLRHVRGDKAHPSPAGCTCQGAAIPRASVGRLWEGGRGGGPRGPARRKGSS